MRRSAARADEAAMRRIERQKAECPVVWLLVDEAQDAIQAIKDWTPEGARKRRAIERVMLLLSDQAFRGPDISEEEADNVRQLLYVEE
jgi:hypothetical protein